MEIKKIPFHQRGGEIGTLAFLEANRDISFDIKRIYYIFGVPSDTRRGFHAHKKLQQVFLCIHGSCKVLLDNGIEQVVVDLNDPTEGLVINNPMWREMYDFSRDAVLVVLASDYYDENDYIRSYDDFLAYMKECLK